jgi:hypothetical protein
MMEAFSSPCSVLATVSIARNAKSSISFNSSSMLAQLGLAFGTPPAPISTSGNAPPAWRRGNIISFPPAAARLLPPGSRLFSRI